MPTIKEALKCLALASLCAVLLGAGVLVWRLPRIVNRQADETRAALMAETHIAIVDANQNLAGALSLLDTRSEEALTAVRTVSNNADRRTAEALEIVRTTQAGTGIGLNRIGREIHEQLTGMRTDLKPSLDGAAAFEKSGAALVKDAQDSLDDSYFDLKATIESATVATHSVAVASEVIAKAAPSLVDSADKIAKSSVDTSGAVAATGKEVAIAAKKFNAPQTKWQAFRMWLLTAARIAGDF